MCEDFSFSSRSYGLKATRFTSLAAGRAALTLFIAGAGMTLSACAQPMPAVHNSAGIEMSIDRADNDPAIHVKMPGGTEADHGFNILLPEHVTVRARGNTDAKHLYVFQPGLTQKAPIWSRSNNSLFYTADLGDVVFTARATLESDGIRFRYDFENKSAVDYDMVWAVTDPRFRVFFYDPRLERTYVHESSGFTLLASQTPERLTMPLSKWFPARYHAQFTAPIPSERVQHRSDGITYYYRQGTVDIPLIATVSQDGQWIAASFARDPGNVWSNPELTCQHVDPQVSLPKGGHAFYELKILLFKGSLDQAYRKAKLQIPTLEQSESTK